MGGYWTPCLLGNTIGRIRSIQLHAVMSHNESSDCRHARLLTVCSVCIPLDCTSGSYVSINMSFCIVLSSTAYKLLFVLL